MAEHRPGKDSWINRVENQCLIIIEALRTAEFDSKESLLRKVSEKGIGSRELFFERMKILEQLRIVEVEKFGREHRVRLARGCEPERILQKWADQELRIPARKTAPYQTISPDRIAEEQLSVEQEKIRSWLESHYLQMVHVYEKWFQIQSMSDFVMAGYRTVYNVSNASIILIDENFSIMELNEPSIIKLEEPFSTNRRIIQEAVEHLKCYPEVWRLWTNSKKEVGKNLREVKKSWKHLRRTISIVVAAKCSKLLEWNGLGKIPPDYYSPRITFSRVWDYLEHEVPPTDLKITPEGEYFRVSDLAICQERDSLKRFMNVIRGLVTDARVKKRVKRILDAKKVVEDKLQEFRGALENITDDVQRRHQPLKCTCPTCRQWILKSTLDTNSVSKPWTG